MISYETLVGLTYIDKGNGGLIPAGLPYQPATNSAGISPPFFVMSLPAPNHTQVPNAFIDEFMRSVSPTATKVFITICRKTIGWHKESDRISQSQLCEISGLAVNTVKKAVQELIRVGLATQHRTRNGYEYDIKFYTNNPQAEKLYQSLIGTPSKFDTPTLSKFDTTKETKKKLSKEREDKERSRSSPLDAAPVAPLPETLSTHFETVQDREVRLEERRRMLAAQREQILRGE